MDVENYSLSKVLKTTFTPIAVILMSVDDWMSDITVVLFRVEKKL